MAHEDAILGGVIEEQHGYVADDGYSAIDSNEARESRRADKVTDYRHVFLTVTRGQVHRP
jgi:hypothetical protein